MGRRLLIAIGVAYIIAMVTERFMPISAAVGVALVSGAVTWGLTTPRRPK